MSGGHRLHAARVALAATVIVLGAYAACAFGLRVFVGHRLNEQMDSQLRTSLARESTLIRTHRASTSGREEDTDTDTDDVPVFFWRVGPHGIARSLTDTAPSLARRRWSAPGVTLQLADAPFRLVAARVGPGWLVAGESAASVGRVDAALVAPELLFGLLLALATFGGSFVVGLRASAPLEMIRRHQAEFTADASHELRTPLSVVEAEVDLALRRGRSVEEYESVLRRIGAEGRRLRRIVDDLLWLARADNGPPATDRLARADVAAIVAVCVDRFQAIAERRKTALTFQRHGSLPAAVHAPPEWVDRLAGVLIDNACKYAGQGGAVAVTVTTGGHRVLLSVDDSGPGIPPAERRAVFDRFRRATSDQGGSGLGLAIADSVVRATEGTWSVEDAPLGGARLTVSWKRLTSRKDAPPSDGPERRATGAGIRLRRTTAASEHRGSG